MDVAGHIAALDANGPRLATAAARAGLAADVPTCPGWTVRDLVRHLGGVHRWATGIVATPRREPWRVDLDAVVGTWPADGDLLEWFLDGHATLVATLRRADPGLLDCWTFLRAPSPLAMWARRQAHETAVHRVDAERAGGDASPFEPRFAADGIDELLSCFVVRPGGRLRADPPRVLGVRATDVPARWRVRIGPDRVETAGGVDGAPGEGAGSPGEGASPTDGVDCEVSGPASDLYLMLWNRRDTAGLGVEGDGDVLALFLDRVNVRWR